MRPIWKGSISFGLVYIPIAVYPATREEKLSFRQLRATDLSPIRYKKVAEVDMKEVSADQIVKGFEYERGRYIVLKDEDFEKVRIESTHSIDITDFVELEQVDNKMGIAPKVEVKALATYVVDLVKVLQESLNRNQSVKVKRGSNRNGRRTSTALVKQKRRAAA